MMRPEQPASTPSWWLLSAPKAPATLLVPKRKREEALGSIGEYIFRDADGDGVPKVGTGIAGVTVELMQAEGIWGNIVIATKVTGADGGYKFDNLPAGEYVVKVSNVPDDLVYNRGLHNPQEGTVEVILGAGEHRADIDIGYIFQEDRDNDEDDGGDGDRSGRQLWIALGRKMGFCTWESR